MEIIPNQTDLGPVKGNPPAPPIGYTAGTSTNFPDSPFAYPQPILHWLSKLI